MSEFFHLGFNVLQLVLQLFVIYYGYVLFRMVRPLKFWTRAWGIFTVSMILVFLRRSWNLFELFSGCPDHTKATIEALLMIVISALWLCFSYKLEHLFKKYLNGEGVLLEREQVIESREKTAQSRENVVGKREVEVQKREDAQKHSGYYKDWKEK